MQLPYPDFLDTTPIKITLTSLGENGYSNVVAVFDGNCCFVEGGKTTQTSEGQTVNISLVTIKGDIAPDANLEGTAEIGGKVWVIQNGTRPRNPDGTVHHTELELV